MNFIKKNFFGVVLVSFLVIIPITSVSFAQSEPPPPLGPPSTPPPSPPLGPPSTPSLDTCAGKICNPLDNVDTIQDFILVVLEGVLKIGLPIVALAIIYCGFLFVSAMGRPEKLTKAKDALLYTLIGAAILFGSWAIALLISTTVTSLGP